MFVLHAVEIVRCTGDAVRDVVFGSKSGTSSPGKDMKTWCLICC